MQKYAKVVNEETGACIVGLGDAADYYESIGMELMDVEESPEGGWYLTGKAPAPSAEYQAQKSYSTLQRRVVMQAVPFEDDATAYTLAPVCPDWEANRHYEAGEIVNHEGIPYRVILKVDSLEHQFPGAEGMLAVYRPIDPAAGTADDPKRFYYGMDVEQGKYYAWNNKLYLAKADMKPCTWEPGSAGVWQWEEIING